MPTNIRRESIIDSWSTLIEHAAGRDKQLMDEISRFITEANMPHVMLARDECVTRTFGTKRDFLILKHDILREYRIFTGARDYGANLDISWFMTFVPYAFSRRRLQNLDMFIQQDLRAFASVALHCTKKAVEALCEELQQSPAGLNTASKGFLTVW